MRLAIVFLFISSLLGCAGNRVKDATAEVPPANRHLASKKKPVAGQGDDQDALDDSADPSNADAASPEAVGKIDCSQTTFPNSQLTPGAFNPDVNDGNVDSTICVHGYTKQIRNVSEATAHQVFDNYGIGDQYDSDRGGYEVDHLLSLELGGSNDIKNLWPQRYAPKPGARQKDVVETNLHRRICNHEITLSQARQMILSNWCNTYNDIIRARAQTQ